MFWNIKNRFVFLFLLVKIEFVYIKLIYLKKGYFYDIFIEYVL